MKEGHTVLEGVLPEVAVLVAKNLGLRVRDGSGVGNGGVRAGEGGGIAAGEHGLVLGGANLAIEFVGDGAPVVCSGALLGMC